MLQLLSTTFCLRESQFIFPEGWTTCDIWQWSIRRFIQLFQRHTQTRRGWDRGLRSHHTGFDRLNRLTYSCCVLMCNDPWWSWYNPSHSLALWCQCMRTYEKHSIKTLIFLNLAVFQMNSSLWYCMWLNSSNNIYCVNRKPGTVSPMLFKAMFLCQKLLGNGLFCVFLSQFLRMPIQIMSTKWKRFSDHCIVLTKRLISTVSLKYHQPFCALEII